MHTPVQKLPMHTPVKKLPMHTPIKKLPMYTPFLKSLELWSDPVGARRRRAKALRRRAPRVTLVLLLVPVTLQHLSQASKRTVVAAPFSMVWSPKQASARGGQCLVED